PIPDSSAALPSRRPPMMREHRLYQADWLMRVYGFARSEIVAALPGGMLDLEHDPKTSFALANRHLFPIDLQRADREMILRVPGLGVRAVDKILTLRRVKRLTLDDIRRLAGSVKKAKAFIVVSDWKGGGLTDVHDLATRLTETAQPDLFDRV
ncbi:MAG: putative modification/repair radical protein, partial [Caulobacteraceae bacterium]|nr:putative modification/repair radical protein [Caulobacteraceae bacterium]